MGRMMQNLVMTWWNGLPTGAYVFVGLLLAGTFALVRAGFHPTVFALISWPGTVCHELAHAAVGFLLNAKPRSFSLLPKNLGAGQWELGHVGFINLRWYNAPWTGLAPMLLAPMAVALATDWAYPHWAAGDLAGAAWRLSFCIVILQASCPSSTDLQVAAPGLLIIAAGVTYFW